MANLLFNPDDLPERPPPAQPAKAMPAGKPRVRVPIRDQMKMEVASLDGLLEADHPARFIWAAVTRLDLSLWLGEIKAVERGPGRDAIDPHVLVALWVYAVTKGIGSAREIGRLCSESLPFRWLCGDEPVNYHTLADFRSKGGEKWDNLLTQIVGSLMHAGLVTLERVAQDGMKIRANAGKSSFRRASTLEGCLEEARKQVETVNAPADDDEKGPMSRQSAARKRAAREKLERLEEALRQCEEVQEQREATAERSGREAKEPRASTTDPEARVMKFPDNGYRPGCNMQFATETKSGVIAGVAVTNAGIDGSQLVPMLDQLKGRYGKVPDEALVDGGFGTVATIEQADKRGCTVYAPLKNEEKQRASGKDPNAPKKKDSKPVAQWRERMGTDAAKVIYKLRCQVAEWVNARCRNWGLWRMPVRGLTKCRNVALLYAITHNLNLTRKLCAEAAIEGN
jgi:transposase